MMKLRKDCQLYALGMKNWVELRVGKKPPKATVSTCSKTIQITQPAGYTYMPLLRADGTLYGYQRVPTESGLATKKIILKTTTWDGGRVIGSVTDRRFRILAGLVCRNGTCVEVPARSVDLLFREVDRA